MFDLQKAYILTKTGGKGGKTYQLVIVTPFRYFAVLSHVSYQENQEVTFKINDFINSGRALLLVQQNQRHYLFFLSLFLLVMIAMPTAVNYAAFFATSPVTTSTFYKSIDKVFIERKSLRVKQVIEHSLENILRFDIPEKQFRYSKLYRAVIVLKLFKEIPINPQYTDENSIRYTVSKIHLFLKL